MRKQRGRLTVWQRVDLGITRLLDPAQARQRVDAIDVHGARSANSLPATSSEGQSGILFVLDFDQGVQDHWSAGVQVNLVRLEVWLFGWLVWVLSQSKITVRK